MRPRTFLPFLWLLSSSTYVSADISQRPLDLDENPESAKQPSSIHLLYRNTSTTLPTLLNALDVLQSAYFADWQGLYPTSIDWTSAVIGTYLSSALSTISSSYAHLSSHKSAENTINKHFSQLVASYFGQDAFSLRQQAYDDMLWVVLGWLESVKFIRQHGESHFGGEGEEWYGEQWSPAFAHRARLFWDLARQGWDTKLCGGGMIWSPYLEPYKNAITNELWITASISMYLYFPGDDNMSPYVKDEGKEKEKREEGMRTGKELPHEAKYLAAAIEGYKWLLDSNMTDSRGLFVDGYHISGWSRARPGEHTRCDARNEMVYTYNQGVLLSGQRGLYEATGARSYLEDGHKLISDVISATGWSLDHNTALEKKEEGKLGQWHGLGRSGILEEVCDSRGYCSQDAQTFKGIFFHHLTLFCGELPDRLVLPAKMRENEVPGYASFVKQWHARMCKRYEGWIKHNAFAALSTQDQRGRFGMWWGAPAHGNVEPVLEDRSEVPEEAVDYRNAGIPEEWKDARLGRGKELRAVVKESELFEKPNDNEISGSYDLNDRGRGRTVETQGGGVAVLRALWELVEHR